MSTSDAVSEKIVRDHTSSTRPDEEDGVCQASNITDEIHVGRDTRQRVTHVSVN